jgi:hypothetical protein
MQAGVRLWQGLHHAVAIECWRSHGNTAGQASQLSGT